MEREPFLHSQPSTYRIQPEYSLEDALNEPPKKLNRARLASPSKVYPTKMERAACIGKEGVVRAMTIQLSINTSEGPDLGYTYKKKSDTKENRCGKRCRQKKRSSRKSRSKKYKSGKYRNMSSSEGSDPVEDRADMPERKKVRSLGRKKKTVGGNSDDIGTPIRTFPLEVCSPHHRNIQTSRVVVLILIQKVTGVAIDDI